MIIPGLLYLCVSKRMLFDCNWCWVLADAAKEQPPPFWTFLPPIIAMVALFYLLMILPQQREKQKKDSILNSLKKNDRVVTIGGIIGTVANVSADGKEITLKMVDDTTRIKFTRSAVSHKLEDEPAKDEPKS
jgi:preprotein translocase subunit YajC